jgi:transporter family-2 protein
MDNLVALASLVAGGLLAVQAGANAQLARSIRSPFGAASLQLGVGLALLLVVAALAGDLGALAAVARVPWWHAAGGAASALYVTTAILVLPRLGAVVSVGLFIAGQMFASLALDACGLLGVPLRPLGAWTLGGALAVLAGAAAIVVGQKGAAAAMDRAKAGWMGLALVAGAALPVQGAINALLKADLGAPLAASAVSFGVALVTVIVVVVTARVPRPDLRGLAAAPWWAWLGGLAGAVYVTTVFTAIPVIGAAATTGLTVTGQQVASVLVDRFGWLRLPRRAPSPLRLAGAALLLAGVAWMKA